MTLDKNDFLTFQLFTASKTPRVKKSRIRGWIYTTVTLLCLTFLFYRSNNEFLGTYFLIASGLSLTLYPIYSRWRYEKHYSKYVDDTYKTRFGEQSSMEITEDTIITKDKTGEVRINKGEIEEINEIQDYYFLRTKSGVSLIISKIKTDDIENIKSEIKSLVDKGVKHNIELNWRWR